MLTENQHQTRSQKRLRETQRLRLRLRMGGRRKLVEVTQLLHLRRGSSLHRLSSNLRQLVTFSQSLNVLSLLHLTLAALMPINCFKVHYPSEEDLVPGGLSLLLTLTRHHAVTVQLALREDNLLCPNSRHHAVTVQLALREENLCPNSRHHAVTIQLALREDNLLCPNSPAIFYQWMTSTLKRGRES
jgi:hypothetical protein